MRNTPIPQISSKVFQIISLTIFLSGVAWTTRHAAVAYQLWQRPGPSNHATVVNHHHQSVDLTPTVYEPVFDRSKIALLIEDRPLSVLAPLLLHFITVLPPDWSVQFIGSPSSIAELSTSRSISVHVQSDKLKIIQLPERTDIASQELISRFMTSLWLWEEALAPAEIVLIFQTDSIICSKSHNRIDQFLKWDWIGAPWRNKNRLGGNGGLSLRRRAAILEILRAEKRRDNDDFEDVWFTKRLKKNKKRIAPRPQALKWSGESQLPDTMLELNASTEGGPDPRLRFEPMGYHIGNSGDQFHTNIWGTKELRDHVYSYCPEIKMLLAMDAAQYVPGNCQSSWEWGKNATLDHPNKPQQKSSASGVP